MENKITIFKKIHFTNSVKEVMFSKMQEEKRKIGLREFSKQANLSFTTLSRIQNGTTPDLESFFKLCCWMNKNPNEFTTNTVK